MKTITIETSELSGASLDWAVSQAVGKNPELMDVCCGYGVGAPPECCCDPDVVVEVDQNKWSPTTLWSQGGPLIEEHVTALNQSDYGGWWAHSGDHVGEAITPLIALCRAIVAAKLGDTVDVPADLVEVKS